MTSTIWPTNGHRKIAGRALAVEAPNVSDLRDEFSGNPPLNLRLGQPVDPFRSLRLSGPSALQKIQEKVDPQGDSSSTTIVAELDYNAFQEISTSRLSARLGIEDDRPGALRGDLRGKNIGDARAWRASRSIGVAFAHVRKTGTIVPSDGDEGIQPRVLPPQTGEDIADFKERFGEFYVSSIGLYRGIVVFLEISEAASERYQKIQEEYEASPNYRSFVGNVRYELSEEIRSATLTNRLSLGIQVLGRPDNSKMGELINGLKLPNLASGAQLEDALKSIIVNQSNFFDGLQSFLGGIFQALVDDTASDHVAAVELRAYDSVFPQLPRRWTPERAAQYAQLESRLAVMQQDALMVSDMSGPYSWMMDDTLLPSSERAKLIESVGSDSFSQYMSGLVSQMTICRLGPREAIVPIGEHAYHDIMPQWPMPPTVTWSLKTAEGSMLKGQKAAVYMQGEARKNWHPLFTPSVWGSDEYRPWTESYIGPDVHLDLVVSMPYFQSVYVGIIGDTRGGRNRMEAAEPCRLPAMGSDCIRPLEGRGPNTYEVPLKRSWPTNDWAGNHVYGGSDLVPPLTPGSGIMKRLGQLLNSPQCQLDHSTHPFGGIKGYERDHYENPSLVYLRFLTVDGREYFLVIGHLALHILWADFGGSVALNLSRGGYLRLLAYPYFTPPPSEPWWRWPQ